MTDMREMTPDELLARIEAEWPHAANDAQMMLERERRTAARAAARAAAPADGLPSYIDRDWLDHEHPVQYGFLNGKVTLDVDNPNTRDRMNRCPKCEEWSPCRVRTLYELAALAATEQREGLDVGTLAKALWATHPMLYPAAWPDDYPDEIGPSPTEDAQAIAAEYAKLHHASPGPDRWKERSRTLQGIADAMADQWGTTHATAD